MLTRRNILIGGGAGVGLVVAWTLWPRTYAPNLVLNPGEHGFGAWLKIGSDGHVSVAVPQAEHGQGSWTALPQIVADELGADWRTVGVEPAPPNPLYANPLGLSELLEGVLGALPGGEAIMLTGGSTSVRMFEGACREAGAAARVLLAQVAATRWGVAWQDCTARDGFVVHGKQRVRFAELAEAAASGTLPDPLPIGVGGAGRLMGQSVARIDAPSKVDGSANFAGDVRLPDMVHAAVRAGPTPESRLLSVDRAAADRISGVVSVVTADHWVAAVATTGWAAQRALDAMAPRFETRGTPVTTASIDAALGRALAADGVRLASVGEEATGGREIAARYDAALGVHAAIETPTATAAYRDGRLELWLATQAPGAARDAAARACGLSADAIVMHPMPIGGSFGVALEHAAAEQAAVLAVKLLRPVSLVWSRGEATLHDRYRPPARARMRARIGANGAILGWRAAIAAPSTGHALARCLVPGAVTDAALAAGGRGDRYAVAGALPPYRIPAVAVDHHPAEIDVPTGHLRGGAHGYTAFFTECFLDKIARVGGNEPLSFRIGMLGGEPRLARCLSTAAALGGWDGGVAGSGQGIACHAFRGSYIAVLADAHVDGDGDGGRIVVDRLVAAVDCGRQINPDLVRQQIEGGLIFGLAHALGASTGFAGGLAEVRGFDRLAIPRLADTPDLTVELIASDEAPGGVSEIGMPAVVPAIANALFASTGVRLRTLPLRAGG
ncbi:molybdopterin cofactor-binding domain-containing protein [Sphingomonas sp.]|uniref:xanthine dehydrogenase family protein molybdopterin-binding subunit n=1 Tax=Sphingomonas sp. TaxID=28214 RepID=UPI0035BC1A63